MRGVPRARMAISRAPSAVSGKFKSFAPRSTMRSKSSVA